MRAGGGSKTIETDELRDALKLVLALIAAVYRDALLVQCAGAERRALPRNLAAVDELARSVDAGGLAERIEAIATAERMLDRNVAPQLTCEHLAVALTGGLPTA